MVTCPHPDCEWHSWETDTCDCFMLSWQHPVRTEYTCSCYKHSDRRMNILSKDELIMSLYVQGCTTKEIVEETGLTYGQMTRWYQAHNLKPVRR